MDKEYFPLRTQDSFILSKDAFFIANARSTEMAEELTMICNSHAKLVEALESITNFGGTFTGEDAREMWLIADEALQQLKENNNAE